MDFTMPLPKPQKLEESILITHQGCMDGSGCAIMFLGAGGKRENIRYVAAGSLERFIKEDPILQSDKFLIFADVAINPSKSAKKYCDLLERRGNVVLLDHHDTSLHMADREWAVIERENQRCGTRMLRDYLIEQFPEEAKFLKSSSWRHFADTIDDHDRWQEQIPSSMDLAMFMTFVGQESFIDRFRDPKERVCRSIADGRGKSFFTEFEQDTVNILRMRREEATEKAIKHMVVRPVKLPDGSQVTVGFIFTADPNISYMLNEALIRKPEVEMVASVYAEKGTISLRSRKDGYDCGKFASFFGGGGHKAAAGHRLPGDLHQHVLEHIYG